MQSTIKTERLRIRMNGIVQGVGFRPFVYKLAQELGLSGFVQNDPHGLLIEVQGPPIILKNFQNRLVNEPPSLARIVRQCNENIDPHVETDFNIRATDQEASADTGISPDVAVCDQCLAEMSDPKNRRYQYPFINCTQCGPRFTIMAAIPYDRPNTSMSAFPLCSLCQAEYNDPWDRRFHAQPIACPVCGPHLFLCKTDGNRIESQDIFFFIWEKLSRGAIIAIRGIGGFHLCVDAQNSAALQRLRLRKGRQEKPFAIMARNTAVIERHCRLDETERALLQFWARPIVLLKKKATSDIGPEVAPANRYLGMMLPYAPLHHLLLSGPLDLLVMTSANYSEEPIAISNEETLNRLPTIADFFVMHDREILQRCDDSVTRVMQNKPRPIRRSRGYVPEPILIASHLPQPILACGGELKNVIALGRHQQVYLSQHIGDLDNPSALDYFKHAIRHLCSLMEIKPALIACDFHPGYLSTQWAHKQKEIPVLRVQHHHAHLVSVMAENLVEQPCIGIILDGTGYGDDGTIWGGEVLVGDARGFERFAWLQPTAMPGGEMAIRQPWRMALGHLYTTYGNGFLHLDLPVLQRRDKAELSIISQMLVKQVNAPLTSSCGRLFDAVAALIGLRDVVSYEAQAAIELEMIADEKMDEPYPLSPFSGQGVLPVDSLIDYIVKDIQRGCDPALISKRFHATLVEIFVHSALAARQHCGLNRVALSGGVYQNALFFRAIYDQLAKAGFQVLSHTLVPANDGGLALGQVLVAAAQAA